MAVSFLQSISARFFFYMILTFLLTVTAARSLHAQVENSSELFQTLARADSLLFEESFNKCNHAVLDTMIADGLTFYHDTGGIQDRQAFETAVHENICSDPKYKPIRRLVPGSLEVFPLRSNGQIYGAIQTGVHEFYMKEPGKKFYQTSIANFTHVWRIIDGRWKIETVLSYDHQAID